MKFNLKNYLKKRPVRLVRHFIKNIIVAKKNLSNLLFNKIPQLVIEAKRTVSYTIFKAITGDPFFLYNNEFCYRAILKTKYFFCPASFDELKGGKEWGWDNPITKPLHPNWKSLVASARKRIHKTLKNTPGFDYVTFFTWGPVMHIAGHHKSFKATIYGDQIVSCQDFSDFDACVDKFISMWKVESTAEKVNSHAFMLSQFAQYGCN